MKFHILGPLEVLDGDEATTIEAPKPRALLSVLLLHPNQVLSRDRLIEELWGERPPATATKVVQTYVSQLRRALGPGVIVTRPPGYLVRVQAEALDSERFRDLAAEARRLAANGDPAQASAVYREALALWRGPPLVDVVLNSFARTEAGQLEEERLEALIERIECELSLGHHEALSGELETLVEQHPTRERLRAQLMLALYRSGRQADALETYRQGRRILVDDLGLEPSRELQALEAAILTHDPVLTGEPQSGRPSALPASTETGTIVVADIDGFTRLTRELSAEDVGQVVAEIHRLMHSTLGGSVGPRVLVFGDSALTVFRSARTAIEASLRLQDAIASHRWPGGRTLTATIVVHSGEVVATGSGYFGLAVNQLFVASESVLASRQEVSLNGRILISEATRALLDGSDLAFRPCAGGAPMPFPLFELTSGTLDATAVQRPA